MSIINVASGDISLWLLLIVMVIVYGGDALYTGFMAVSRWWDTTDMEKPPFFPNVFSLVRFRGIRMALEFILFCSLFGYYSAGFKGIVFAIISLAITVIILIATLIVCLFVCKGCAKKKEKVPALALELSQPGD